MARKNDSSSVSDVPLPKGIEDAVSDLEDLLYISRALEDRTTDLLHELGHLQRTSASQMVRDAARSMYNAISHGGKTRVGDFTKDLEQAERGVERAVKARVGRYVRNAAILKLAKAATTSKLADGIREMEKACAKKKRRG